MRIAVIGCNGFIGSNLVDYLCRIENIEVLPVHFSDSTRKWESVRFDAFVEDNTKLDVVVFAGGNSVHLVEDEKLYEVIQKDSRYIMEVFQSKQLEVAIMLSSAAVYYGYTGFVNEETCPKPNTNYGISKRLAEMIFEKEIKKKGIKGIILRLTHAYGRGEKTTRLYSKIAYCIKSNEELKVFGNGESYINPVPVEYLGEVVYQLAKEPSEKEIDYYNVGSYEPIKVKDIVFEASRRFGLRYRFEGDETQPVNFVVDVTKLAKRGLVFKDALKRYMDSLENVLSARIK
ncbi:NAD(P)-dependent oxidoreductase [Fervidobacterium pennivorans subsp. carthaginiensis]|uniref:NAD-dependent epimerase/dehydratase family protein n=1 Tax=Fervidobacterium pennivorans TaxID=93466 RepID=UPI00355AD76C